MKNRYKILEVKTPKWGQYESIIESIRIDIDYEIYKKTFFGWTKIKTLYNLEQAKKYVSFLNLKKEIKLIYNGK